MKYPQEFIDKCKKVYPIFKDLHKHLEVGSEFVGRYLDDSREESISLDELLGFVNKNNIAGLVKKIEKCKEKNELYYEWDRLYDAQH